jgi:drug/metabolite transporter (DMT)-like permease
MNRSTPIRQREDVASSAFGLTDWLLILMTIIWGSNFSVIKYALEDFNPLTFTASRFVIASIALVTTTVLQGKSLSVAR